MTDQFAQMFMKVAPDGSITFDFEGVVHARGLDLPEGTAPVAPEESRIRWVRESDGFVAQEIIGNLPSSLHELELITHGSVNDASLLIAALEGGAQAFVQANAGSAGVSIIDNLHRSTLVRNAVDGGPIARETFLNFDTQEFVFSGAVSSVTVNNIPHGLGKTPRVILAMQQTTAARFGFGATGINDTDFDLTMFTTNLATPTGTFTAGWFAIG